MSWSKPTLERLSADRHGERCQQSVSDGMKTCGKATGTPHLAVWRLSSQFSIDGQVRQQRERLLCSSAAAAYCHAHGLVHPVFNPAAT